MPKLTLALHSSGKPIDIRDASNGLACDCICFCCGEPLIARQGEIKDWSFAHESESECFGALETALHKSAIRLITDEKKLYIGEYDPINSSPKKVSKYKLEECYEQYQKTNPESTLSQIEYFSNKEIALKIREAQHQCLKSRITFSEAYSEKRAEGSTRKPDVTGVYKGQKIYIEIVVTHKCDEEKISELNALGVPTIQINISSLLQKELSLKTIRDAIFNLTTFANCPITREWLVKPKYIQDADLIAAEYFDVAKVKLQELEVKKMEFLAEKRARRKIIVIDQVELHIDQRDTWGTIWFSQRISRLTPAIDLIFKQLKAKLNDYFWTVQEGNIVEKIQNIQEKIAVQEKARKEKELADKKTLQEESRRLREEKERVRKIEDEILLAKLADEEKVREEQARIRKAREKEIIAEVEKKHQGITNYQFRRKKIIDELNAQGITYW